MGVYFNICYIFPDSVFVWILYMLMTHNKYLQNFSLLIKFLGLQNAITNLYYYFLSKIIFKKIYFEKYYKFFLIYDTLI